METLLKKLSISNDKGFVYLTTLFASYNITIYAVGGAVRDCLLESDKQNIDIDVAIPCSPDEVKAILVKKNIKTIDIGINYGTVIAHLNQKNYEITSFRKDIKPDGRHSVVTFGHDIFEDALRRDFTINALYYHHDGVIYDPTGFGIQDIQKKYVRFIGDAHCRIQEDHLRVLRYFRFLTRFGIENYNQKIFDQENYTPLLEKISRERIAKEIQLLLVYDNATLCLDILLSLGYLPVIFRNLILDISFFTSIKKITLDISYLLAALLHQNEGKEIKNSLKLSNQEIRKIEDFKRIYKEFYSYSKPINPRYLLGLKYDYPIHIFNIMCHHFMTLKPDDATLYKKILDLPILECNISGKKLLAQGYKSGLEIGNILKEYKENMIQEQYDLCFKGFTS